MSNKTSSGYKLWPLLLAGAVMVGAVGTAEALRPHKVMADIKPKLVLKDLVPLEFGDWRELPSARPVLPDPTVQAVLDATYSEVLARGYIDKQGNVVLVSIAYGRDQTSETNQVHRPEFCYTGQGFMVKGLGDSVITMADGHGVPVRRLEGKRDSYYEQISYWVTLDESAALPGLTRKLHQLGYGLQGKIVDGMLVRISSPGRDPAKEQALHDRFVRDLGQHIDPQFRARFFGT